MSSRIRRSAPGFICSSTTESSDTALPTPRERAQSTMCSPTSRLSGFDGSPKLRPDCGRKRSCSAGPSDGFGLAPPGASDPSGGDPASTVISSGGSVSIFNPGGATQRMA